ncbi:NADAR family protein [Bacillus stercoris]|nr:NADAR family protein [Bacillus stercoris]
MSSYEFFWQGRSPFSQWHRSIFTVDGVKFTSAEQFMMYSKAKLMGDEIRANLILRTNDPRNQKRLGRQVSPFDQKKWDEHKMDIVYKGNHAKFTQNRHLMNALVNTKGKELVEASPYDKEWGIGLGPDHPDRFDKSKWKERIYLVRF